MSTCLTLCHLVDMTHTDQHHDRIFALLPGRTTALLPILIALRPDRTAHLLGMTCWHHAPLLEATYWLRPQVDMQLTSSQDFFSACLNMISIFEQQINLNVPISSIYKKLDNGSKFHFIRARKIIKHAI